MSSITIHALDGVLDFRLTEEARKRKTSKNQLVKDLLSRSLGLGDSNGKRDEYSEFCGLWTNEEKQSFNEIQQDNSRIDEKDWT